MKVIFFTIFTLLAHSQTCNEGRYAQVKKQLFDIAAQEAKQLSECQNEGASGTQECERYDAIIAYNKALAEYTLVKGIQAIGIDLENSSADVKLIDPKFQNNAVKALNKFEKSFEKARVIQAIMIPLEDKTFFYDKWDNSKETLEEFTANQCSALKQKKQLHQLCIDSPNLPIDQKKELIAGFIDSYERTWGDDDLNREGNYKVLSGKLNVLNEGVYTTLEDYKNHPNMKLIESLRESLKKISLSVADREKIKSDLSSFNAIALNLENNFKNPTATKRSKLDQETYEQIVFNQVRATNDYNILEYGGRVKSSINSTLSTMKESYNRNEELFKQMYPEVAGCQNITQCVNDSTEPKVKERWEQMFTLDRLESALEKQAVCMNSDLTDQELLKCFQEASNGVISNLGVNHYKRELEKKKNDLLSFNSSEEQKALEETKQELVQELIDMDCVNKSDFTSSCLAESLGRNEQVLNLADGTQGLLVRLQTDLVFKNKVQEDPKSSPGPQNKKNANSDSSYIYDSRLTDKQNRKNKKRYEKKRQAYQKFYYRQTKYQARGYTAAGSSTFLNNFAQTLSMGAPRIQSSIATARAITAQRQANSQYYNWALEQGAQNGFYYGQANNYQNWGLNSYNPNYMNSFNYGNTNLYYNGSPGQYTHGWDHQTNNTFSPYSYQFGV